MLVTLSWQRHLVAYSGSAQTKAVCSACNQNRVRIVFLSLVLLWFVLFSLVTMHISWTVRNSVQWISGVLNLTGLFNVLPETDKERSPILSRIGPLRKFGIRQIDTNTISASKFCNKIQKKKQLLRPITDPCSYVLVKALSILNRNSAMNYR